MACRAGLSCTTRNEDFFMAGRRLARRQEIPTPPAAYQACRSSDAAEAVAARRGISDERLAGRHEPLQHAVAPTP
jgi:hypothetical protein